MDEFDAHLHPTWQRRIGHMLRKVFPRVQFIVSTHSPFVAQAATPGGLFLLRTRETAGVDVLQGPGEMDAVRVLQPFRSVRGLRADAILTSDLFGMTDTIDVRTEELLSRYHLLAGRAAFARLSGEEQAEFQRLEAGLGDAITAPGESSDEFRLREESESYIRDTLARVRRTAP